MVSLVNQNKQHARKHTAILQVMTTWRSYIFAPYPRVIWYHIISHKHDTWYHANMIHQYLYFHKIYKRIAAGYLSAVAWNNIQSASFKIADVEIIGKQEIDEYFGCYM